MADEEHWIRYAREKGLSFPFNLCVDDGEPDV